MIVKPLFYFWQLQKHTTITKYFMVVMLGNLHKYKITIMNVVDDNLWKQEIEKILQGSVHDLTWKILHNNYKYNVYIWIWKSFVLSLYNIFMPNLKQSEDHKKTTPHTTPLKKMNGSGSAFIGQKFTNLGVVGSGSYG